MDKDTVVTLLKYKRWIDLATLQAIRAIDGTVHGEKRHLTIRLMNHIHVVDMIFRANLRSEAARLHRAEYPWRRQPLMSWKRP